MTRQQYKSSLATHSENGVFDFFDYTITIKKYSEEEKVKFEKSITHADKKPQEEIKEQIENRSLIKHELTHFTDLTSTNWGMEYIIRKGLVINAINKRDYEKTKQAIDVFMINASELQMHSKLIPKQDNEPLFFTKIEHALDYSPEYGTFIWIYFKDGDSITCSTPLSMLSVLEAHAFANETISQLSDVEKIDDQFTKIITRNYFIETFKATLKDKKLSEYTSLIILTRHHFPELTHIELLKLVCASCKFSLNADDFTMSQLANYFTHSIKNETLGENICHDMRRGASRHLITFKVILFLYGWLHHDESNKSKKIELLKTQPHVAILELWEALGGIITITKPDDDWDFNGCVQRALELNTQIDQITVSECSILNRSALHTKTIGELSLDEIKSPNIFLQRKEAKLEIKLPNTISISAYQNIEDAYAETWDLIKQYRIHPINKFHMTPSETYKITERMNNWNRTKIKRK
ncbi:hypothetical protein [Iodobacter fluviatilis]|uniref:Uncharacterized protein n=1 Tax=Iodobacter fluviatilis TaxID=537 RepID=A0A7G3GD96_9NEIS|nr:hypothetical protein [Iodobacter fluviatilis]QBC45570.1 hypothetical protein C1H71_19940 [Iodobacter fluviatilis]